MSVVAYCSRRCSGAARWCMRAFARSATVSVIPQKDGGLSTQPIGKPIGIATSGGSSSYRGMTHVSAAEVLGCSHIR